MNDDAALSVTTVGTCISLLSDGISTLPFQALKGKTNQPITPAPTLVDDPWPEGSRIDFFGQLMVSLLLRGNFFGRIVERDLAGYATTIMPVHPDMVYARRNRDTGLREYRFGGRLVPLDDVVHIPAMLTPGNFVGLNPVEYQRRSWSVAAAAETYAGQFYANSANPSGIIAVDGDLSEDETLEMARAWQQAHGGLGNAQLPAVLTGGAKWTTVSMSATDAQFLESRTFQQQQIISWFRIPPHKVGVTDRTPAPPSAEDLEIEYVREGLVPWARRIEEYWSRLMRPSQIALFDFSGRLRGNTLQRAQASQIWLNTGQRLIDEARAFENLEPLPHGLGQVIGRPMNMAYFDAETGEMLNMPDPALKPVNPGGMGDGGGDPSNSPNPTQPDQ
jgi:HK97 family phage portal protein